MPHQTTLSPGETISVRSEFIDLFLFVYISSYRLNIIDLVILSDPSQNSILEIETTLNIFKYGCKDIYKTITLSKRKKFRIKRSIFFIRSRAGEIYCEVKCNKFLPIVLFFNKPVPCAKFISSCGKITYEKSIWNDECTLITFYPKNSTLLLEPKRLPEFLSSLNKDQFSQYENEKFFNFLIINCGDVSVTCQILNVENV